MNRALLILAGAIVMAILTAAPAPANDVYGDDANDRYVGNGGLLLPGSVDTSTRRRVAQCPDCQWRLSSPCIAAPPPPGTLMPGQSPASTCQSVVRGCGGGAQMLRAWFLPSGGEWNDLGLICLSEGGPHTVAELAGIVRDAFAASLPRLAPNAQPHTGVLAQVPVLFAAGQPAGGFEGDYLLLGQDVTVQALPRWTWRFGDGGVLVTDRPGAWYPDTSVSHPYRTPGRYRVEVAASWTAHFTVADFGTFPVEEPVRQEAAFPVVVGEGRAVLAVR